MELNHTIGNFIQAVATGHVEIYNEFSLQHEIGIFLRTHLRDCKIQFERNVSHFEFVKSEFAKKEIDIAITAVDTGERLCAIELKYPRNGQVPESMFSFCRDIEFLEQLVASGFKSAYFLAVVDHHHFYTGNDKSIIYSFFRNGAPLTGTIIKPTGAKDTKVTLTGSYTVKWLPILGDRKFFVAQINPTEKASEDAIS
jgi:hypothetical protein